MMNKSLFQSSYGLSISVLFLVGVLKSNALIAASNEIRLVRVVSADGINSKEVDAEKRFSLNLRSAINGRVRARVFAGSMDQLRKYPHRRAGDCWIYDSVFLHPTVMSARLDFEPVSKKWLSVTRGTLQSRTYFLVFETGDLPEGPIKLWEEDVADYFSERYGFQIVVRVPEGLSPTQALLEEIKKGLEQGVLDLERRAKPPVGCAFIASVDEDGMTLAFGDGCAGDISGEATSRNPGSVPSVNAEQVGLGSPGM